MKNSMLCVLACSMLACTPIFSQDDLQLTAKDSIVQSSWMFGVGYNIVDDSGDVFDKLFSVDEQWNAVAFPSRVSIGRYFKNGLGLEAIGTYNKYKEGKTIDNKVNTVETTYLGLDARLTYDLNKLIGETGWFDPYVGVGAGYTDANDQTRGTYNAVVGFRAWFSDRWGIDLSSSGKWAMGNDEATNHIQHAAGVVYQFGIEKGLSKKGEEKLALIQAMEKEKQRIADSLANEQRIKDEAALAERLAREKEKARLAAEIDAENQRKQGIKDAITALGDVYFDFESSSLNASYRKKLDQLVVILKENPTVTILIGAHTDSRGAASYNLWLSEQRAERTKNYLVAQGITADRLQIEAFGETQLVNECDGTVRCSEAKHRLNRRSEFEVVKF
ncbi:OmpA family protein [Maribacter sp. ANRC-HE7]|uniref:OmpA family protein n=1 Tax=Maribacter aquimaris TaxID=2737171 RepID=A0ABR7V1X1_9FLAO|nr:OmpA family protein [Maribacter aquimaris]MBD0778823.1 OmpA family protein [Maribacter aquimaris]